MFVLVPLPFPAGKSLSPLPSCYVFIQAVLIHTHRLHVATHVAHFNVKALYRHELIHSHITAWFMGRKLDLSIWAMAVKALSQAEQIISYYSSEEEEMTMEFVPNHRRHYTVFEI